MRFLLGLEAKYEKFRMKHFTSGGFIMAFYIWTSVFFLLLGPIYRITR